MINIVGIFLIIIGFAWPFLTGWGLSAIFFWFGILALLSPGKFIPKTANWNKWAQAGLLAYLLIALISMLISYLAVVSPVFCGAWGDFCLSLIPRWISAPFTLIFSLVFPLETTQLSDGSYQIKISFIRATTTGFMNIIVYLFAGVLIGRWLQIRRNKS